MLEWKREGGVRKGGMKREGWDEKERDVDEKIMVHCIGLFSSA